MPAKDNFTIHDSRTQPL